MEVSIHDIFATLNARFRPEKAGDYTGCIHFDIKDAPYTVEIRDRECKVSHGLHGVSTCVVRTKPKTYVGIELGKTNPHTALLLGKVKVNHVGEMTRFARMFRKFSTSYIEASPEAGMEEMHIQSRKPEKGPLHGVRILDLSRLLPGPLATQMLADMGAEVIKIEDPNTPDETRTYPPFTGGQSAFYLALNRSKRSLTLNLYSDKGKELLRELIKTADVVFESYRPGVLKKVGLDYKTAKQLNSNIIYVSVTGYGQTGPYAQHAGHDLNYIGYAGLLGLTGGAEGSPVIPGAQIADVAGGSYMAVNACLLALLRRERTGEGAHADVSMLDAMLPVLSLPLAEYFVKGKVPRRGDLQLSGKLAHYNVYACADGKHVALGSLEPRFFQRFCKKAGKEEWMALLVPTEENLTRLKSELSYLFLTQTRDEWIAFADGTDMCLTPVYDLEEVENDPHIRERGMFCSMEHPAYGKFTGLGLPLKLEDVEMPDGWAPPLLGEDSSAILKEIGIAEEEIVRLKKEGIV